MTNYWFEYLLKRLRKPLEKYTITHITRYIVGFNLLVFILSTIKPSFLYYLTFNFEKILHGQVWRLFTYVFIPPSADVIFIFFALYFVYLIGEALEAEWGAFRLNMFYFAGMLATTLVGVVFKSVHMTNVYLNTSLFLAFAFLFPDFMIYLFFVIPVKIKYLGWISWFFIGLTLLFGPWQQKLIIFAGITNYLLFFWPELVLNFKLMLKGAKAPTIIAPATTVPFHKCTICEKSEKDDDNLQFRVCMTCNKEFCLEHLNNHEH